MIGRARDTSSGKIDISMLTPAQRVTAIECLRAIAKHACSVMRGLVIYDAGNEYILTTPLERLDTPEAARRYVQIHDERMKTHPVANLTFGGY